MYILCKVKKQFLPIFLILYTKYLIVAQAKVAGVQAYKL